MKTVNVETLLAKIIPFVSGCNDTIAKIVLADAARTFARETDIITETQGFDIADAPEYGRIPEFAVDKENFLPLHFVARNEDKPNRKVYVTYSLLPTANLMPEAVIDRFHEAITSQALFMLYSMPGKPWTAPDMAQLYLQKYRIAAGDAMRDNNTGGAVFDQFMICGEPGDGGFIGSQNITATIIGTDTSDGDITPNTVLAGYVGYAKGEKVVGNIQSVTASLNKNIFTVPMGYVGSPVTLSIPEVTATLDKNTATVPVGYIGEEQKLTVPVANITNDGEYVTVPVGYVESERKFKVGGNTGVNVDFVTATASDILAGKTGTDKSGNPVYGNIQTVTASKSGNVVNVPKGYIATEQTLTIDAAKTATVSGNVVTIYPGYTATQYTATIPKATSSVSGNVVTIPAGYHDATTKTVAEMAEPSVSGNVVTIPVGYNKVQKTKTIAEAGQTTVSGNQVTTPSGYVKSERKTTVGTAKGAETITPGTADRTIAAGTYLTGALTVKGDADLVAENIAEGKEIFGIAGSFKGGSSMDFYKCAAVYGPYKVTRIRVSGAGTTAVNGDYEKTTLTTSGGYEVWKHMTADYYLYRLYQYAWSIHSDYTTESYQALYYCESEDPTSGSWYTGYDYSTDTATGVTPVPTLSKIQVTMDEDVPKTWDGYKAILTDGIYDFEKTLTTGMAYSIITPKVDGIYSADALVTVSKLYDGTDPHTILYFTMDDKGSAAVDKIHGIKLTATGDMVSGVPGIKNTAWSADTQSSYLSGNQEVFELPQEFTLNAFMRYTSISTNTYVNATIVDFGSWDRSTGFGLWLGKDAKVAGHIDQGSGYNFGSVVLSPNAWYMVTMTYDGVCMKTYINGALDTNISYSGTVKNDTLIATFSRGPGGGSTSECWAGQIDEVSLLDYAMTDEQVAALYAEFDVGGSGGDDPGSG